MEKELNYICFKKLARYKDILYHGITLKGNDFMHQDPESKIFINSKNKIKERFNLNEEDVFFINQVHDKEICSIDENSKSNIRVCDGLMSNCKRKLLVTCYADCVPLLFFDPKNKVVASVHSGWKGTIRKIAAEAVFKMVKTYKSDPKDIIAGIGPSIGPCCFEVEPDVCKMFKREFGEDVILKDKDKLHIDLWRSNIIQLQNAGLRDDNIECLRICTYCNSDKFYSFRKGDKEQGRFAAFIMLN
jgi:YfiH family protein